MTIHRHEDARRIVPVALPATCRRLHISRYVLARIMGTSRVDRDHWRRKAKRWLAGGAMLEYEGWLLVKYAGEYGYTLTYQDVFGPHYTGGPPE